MNTVYGNQQLHTDCMKLALTEVQCYHSVAAISVLDESPLL